jgi:hypothetical protein
MSIVRSTALAVLLAACTTSPSTETTTTAEGTTATTSTTVVTTTTTTTTTTAATTTTTPLPEQAFPGHGGEAYAVYIGAAGADGFDVSTFDEATAAAEALGYDVLGYGDVFCDQGAAEALGLDPDGNWFVTGLYFATEEDADIFAAAYPLPVLAIAQITMFCAD